MSNNSSKMGYGTSCVRKNWVAKEKLEPKPYTYSRFHGGKGTRLSGNKDFILSFSNIF